MIQKMKRRRRMKMMKMEICPNMTSVVGEMKKVAILMTRRMMPHQKAAMITMFPVELAMQASMRLN